jgi:hypothetical protein
VQSAEVRVADAQGVYNVKLARYNEVKRNREIAEQRARTLGSEEGKIAGAKEAELTAAQTGLRMGDQEGKVDGQLKGEGESRLISYSVGFNASLLSPELAPLSYQDGQLKGRKAVDHHASISAYPAEVNRVLDEISTRQPTATVEINMTDDLETVEVDAGLFDAEKKSVASVQKPRKPNAVDEPLYQDPLVKVPTIVVPQPTLGEPVSCQNAHPLFVGSCVTAYRLSHAAEFQDRYRALYAPAYAKAYGESSKDAYGQARSKLVESEKLRGMTDSSLQVGFVDGYLKFEEESISSAIMKARGDVEARLESTSLLRLVSLMIEDANQDGVLSPGETLSFSAVIDNIGGKASKTHSLKMQFVQSVGIQAVESSVELPSLAGDTRTLVHGLLPSVIKVGDRAKIEASMELKYVDSQGQVKVLGSLGVTAEVSLPVSVTQMEIGTIAQVGEEGTLLFTVSNKTKKDFIGASLRVLMNAEIGTPKAETQKLDLAAGTSTKITVPYLVGLGAGGNQSFPVRMSLGDLQGLLPVEQIYDVIVPARRNASLYACLPDCKVNYRMPVRVEAGTEFKIPIILKAHSDSAAKFEYEIRRTESSSPAIMPGDGSFLSTIVSNPRVSSIENRYEIKLRFPLSLKGQAHWMSVVVKEGNKTIHRLFVPFLVE